MIIWKIDPKTQSAGQYAYFRDIRLPQLKQELAATSLLITDALSIDTSADANSLSTGYLEGKYSGVIHPDSNIRMLYFPGSERYRQ